MGLRKRSIAPKKDKSTSISFLYSEGWDFLVVQLVKNLRAMQETQVRFLGQEALLEKG